MLRRHFPVVLSCVLFASCSHDPKKATKANFASAIQSMLDKSPACIAAAVPSDHADFMGRPQPDSALESLVAVGLASKVRAQVHPSDFLSELGHPNQTVPGLRYELSAKAKQYVRRNEALAAMAIIGPPLQSLCFGNKKVTEIVRYSEPSPTMGQTMTEVTYKYALVNVADWAKDPSIEKAYFTNQQLNPQETAAVLILMSDGWRVQGM